MLTKKTINLQIKSNSLKKLLVTKALAEVEAG